MDAHDTLLGLIATLYDAPGTTAGWRVFLESLRTAVDGSAASLLCEDLQSQHCTFAATTFTDPEPMRLYDEHWGSADPWAHSPNSGRLSERSVIVGDELIAHRDMRRTAYYEDFARRYDIVRALVGVLERNALALSVVSISRSERRGPFSEREVALVEPLVPHIARALQLHRQLLIATGAADHLASAIDELSRATLLLDSRGRVIFMNRAAEQLIDARDGLCVDNGELRAARAADTTRLRALLAEAAATSMGQGIGAGGTLALGRPTGRRPLMALVAPLTRRPDFFSNSEPPAAVVIVTDPERVTVPDVETLRALLGLTSAEAALTRLLAQGVALNEAAVHLGLRIETVRTRLKTIFEKTDTHRQADLVRLVLLSVVQP
jgi:DNA-binding CsgD family transcriptional regulator